VEGGNFAGIIIMAGSPRKLEEIIMDQNDDVLHSLNRLLRIIAKKQIAKLSSKFHEIYNLTDEESKSTSVMGKYVRSYYFKEMGEHPAVNYLLESHKPLLILQGDKDFQVSVEKDFNRYKSLLGERPNVTFKLYPNLNHLFMPNVYGQILKMKKEYKVPQRVETHVIHDIADWISAQNKGEITE
jgi:hypothetical protein